MQVAPDDKNLLSDPGSALFAEVVNRFGMPNRPHRGFVVSDFADIAENKEDAAPGTKAASTLVSLLWCHTTEEPWVGMGS